MKTIKQALMGAVVSASMLAAGYAAPHSTLQSTLYTTAWSEYADNYQYDGAYDSKHGGWNKRDRITNSAMVDQFNHAHVVSWSFMQVWNANDPEQAKYNVPSDWDGIMHFSDLYGDLPPSSDEAATNRMIERCHTLAAGSCAAVQMSGASQQLTLFNYADDQSTGQFDSFNAFMSSDKIHAQRIIAIGGANIPDNKSIGYHTYQAIFSNQERFVHNLTQWKAAYPNLSGVDYDFEPPIDSTGAQLNPDAQTKLDYANLLSVVIKTRQALGPDAHISVTLTPNFKYLDAINASHTDAGGHPDWFKVMAQYATSINIMTYDFHGPWGHDSDPTTAVHSRLAQPNIDNPAKFSVSYGAKEVINRILSYGAPANKLQMGIATYARAYSGVPNTAKYENLVGYDQPWAHAAHFPSSITAQDGLVPYKAIDTLVQQGYKKYHVHADLHDKQSPIVGSYLYGLDAGSTAQGNFVGYESPEALQAACQFAKDKGLQGMIIWDAASDKPVSDSGSLLATYNANC